MRRDKLDERRRQIAARLSGGDRRSTGAADAIAAEAILDPALVPGLVALLRHDDEVVRMRAADALEKASRQRPGLLASYTDELLGEIEPLPQQEVRWHVAQMIPRLPLDTAQRGRAIELLKSYLNDGSRIVFVEALTALSTLAADDPALRVWLLPKLEQAAVEGAPSVRARARRLLRRLAHGQGQDCGSALLLDRRASPRKGSFSLWLCRRKPAKPVSRRPRSSECNPRVDTFPLGYRVKALYGGSGSTLCPPALPPFRHRSHRAEEVQPSWTIASTN